MEIVAFFVIFVILLALGVHIGIAMIVSGLLHIGFFNPSGLTQIPVFFMNFLDSYPLMAVPFFIFAGSMMEKTGLIHHLFDFAEALTKRIPAGVGVATICTCMVFAAITGSALAEASAMAVIAIPAMKKRGYESSLAGSIVAAAGPLGMVIPPSMSLILFGVLTDTSIPALFMGGMIPGIILGLLLIVVLLFVARGKGFRSERMVWRDVLKKLKSAVWGLGMPVLVLGGLYGGIFSPTEAGAAGAGYALLYGLFARRRDFLAILPGILRNTTRLTAMVWLLAGGAGIFCYVLSLEKFPQHLAEVVIGYGVNRVTFLIAMNILLLILGCLMEGLSIILIVAPILFPVAMALGIDPVHLGVVITLNIEIGTVTPPVGLVLYAVAGLSETPVLTLLREMIPFIIVMIAFLFVATYCPTLVIWLPHLLFG